MQRIEPDRARGNGNIGVEKRHIPPEIEVKAVKKQGIQRKKYDFVMNNYVLADLEPIERFLRVLCCKFIFQEETGENGTKHLQGAIWLKKKARITELVKYPELSSCSFRVCRNWEALVKYCGKEESRSGRCFVWNVPRPKRPVKTLSEEQLYDWQREIIKLIERDPDDRIIYWYWESRGNVGKSTFCKYLVIKYNAMILSGKAADMKFGIIKYIEKHGDYPELLIFDVPRTTRDFLSYSGIEQVKNGLFFSTKYESDMVVGNPPHLFIFANFRPDRNKMSDDRWRERFLGNPEDVPSSEELYSDQFELSE